MELMITLAILVLFIYLVYMIVKKIYIYIFSFFNKDKVGQITFEIEEISSDEEYIPQTTQVGAKLSPELYKRLNGYCDYKGVSKTLIINNALDKYLNEIDIKEKKMETI